jgi:hypothetical protein
MLKYVQYQQCNMNSKVLKDFSAEIGYK